MEISREYLEMLEKRSFMLSCLQRHGVDNWEGYDYAIEDFNEEYDNEN